MKSGETVEDREGRDMAGYQIRSKPQVPHIEARTVCRTVEKVVGGVGFPLPHAGHDGSTDGSSLF